MQFNKLKTDRKVLRGIDVHLARYASVVSGCYFFSFMVFMLLGDLLQNHPKFLLVFGVTLLLPAMYIFYIATRFSYLYGAAPTRCRQRFNVAFIANAVIYSIFCFFALILNPIDFLFTFALTFNLALMLGINFLWRAYDRIAEAYTVIVVTPIVFVYLFSNMFSVWIIVLMILAIVLIQIYVIRYNQGVFWQRMGDQFLLKEKMKDLETTRRKLKYMSEQRVDLLTDLTHEIRTPMNSVLGMLTLLKDTELDESQKEILSVAEHSGQSMLSLFEDILDFSKIAAGNIALASSVFNLRYCVEGVSELLGPMAHRKGIELSCVFDHDVPIRVRGDEHRIAQVLNNLASNAIKFSESGEVVISVHMTPLSESEGLLRVQVVDQGAGISQDKQDELFRAFHKADASTTRRHGGTGLGLAISKGLVEAMQGQIGLISDVGTGSTFWFTARLGLSTQQVASLSPLKVFVGQRALIVGAPQGLAASLKQELAQWGIDSDSFQEGYARALQLLRDGVRQGNCYDLVILNLGLEYSGNLKLAQILADDPALSGIRQILLTTLEQRGIARIKQVSEKIERLAVVTKPIQGRLLYGALSYLYGVEPITTASTFKAQRIQKPNKRFNILIVEDNKIHQMIASGMLKKLGYSIKSVENGKIAIEMLADTPFDLVLMDCHMPELDGYSATMQIRQREASEVNTGSHIPIIGVTADTAEGEQTRCLAAGMDDVLVKPISIEELDSKLRLWLVKSDFESGVIENKAVRLNQEPGSA